MGNLDEIRERLAHATGTENYWLLFPGNQNFKFTDGVKEVIEICGAYWLITAVFSWQDKGKVKNEPFQVWILRFIDKAKGDDALLICEDGNNRELARLEIEYTDFPLPEGFTLYLVGGVLMLPSEY
jgi:hypothetical protein